MSICRCRHCFTLTSAAGVSCMLLKLGISTCDLMQVIMNTPGPLFQHLCGFLDFPMLENCQLYTCTVLYLIEALGLITELWGASINVIKPFSCHANICII